MVLADTAQVGQALKPSRMATCHRFTIAIAMAWLSKLKFVQLTAQHRTMPTYANSQPWIYIYIYVCMKTCEHIRTYHLDIPRFIYQRQELHMFCKGRKETLERVAAWMTFVGIASRRWSLVRPRLVRAICCSVYREISRVHFMHFTFYIVDKKW
jgi:hypothetical protein